MDISSVLGIAQGLQAQSLAQAMLSANLRQMKGYEDFQVNIATQLLASLPSVNPDGVGGVVDITA
jgi:hypothetical protein